MWAMVLHCGPKPVTDSLPDLVYLYVGKSNTSLDFCEDCLKLHLQEYLVQCLVFGR